jgi:hypothetical protein
MSMSSGSRPRTTAATSSTRRYEAARSNVPRPRHPHPRRNGRVHRQASARAVNEYTDHKPDPERQARRPFEAALHLRGEQGRTGASHDAVDHGDRGRHRGQLAQPPAAGHPGQVCPHAVTEATKELAGVGRELGVVLTDADHGLDIDEVLHSSVHTRSPVNTPRTNGIGSRSARNGPKAAGDCATNAIATRLMDSDTRNNDARVRHEACGRQGQHHAQSSRVQAR